ncbi:MAG: type II CAAX endopeptidase family protein [Deltaproteobacteria bacterium]|nr:type II CAAX endopeptidase family protein [Deltaproteobacteria bacterium]
MALHVGLGGTAQGYWPAWGLVWTELFVFLLPSVMAASGSNLRPGAFLLLARRPTVRQVTLGAAIGVALFFAASGIMSVTTLLVPRSWVDAFDVTHLFEGSARDRLAMALIASLLAPIAEEVAFRGYLLSALRTRLRPGPAIAASSVLFAAMHLDPVRFPAVLFLGAFLGWLAWRSGSLWPAVAAHTANNGLGSIAVLSGGGDPGGDGSVAAGLALLAVGLAALAPLGLAWLRSTPSPPPASDDLVRIDPGDRSVGFHPTRVSPTWLATALAGVLLYGALAAVHTVGRR